MKSVVGLFDTFPEARTVVSELTNAGFKQEDVSLVANDASGENKSYTMDGDDMQATGAGATTGAVVGGAVGVLAGLGALLIPGIGPVIAAGPLLAGLAGAGVGALAGGLLGALVDAGVPDEDAAYYSEGVRRGGALVMVSADDTMAQKAADIMNRNNAVNVEERSAAWREQGWTGYDSDAEAYTTDQIAKERSYYEINDTEDRDSTNGMSDARTMTNGNRTTDDEMKITEMEEELRVGKRQVEDGGVRLTSTMVEEPIEKDITLRQEEVHVERRDVDRAATSADFDTFREGTMDMTEMHEEAVIDKQARVTGEVVVSKDMEERTETVRDSVRHTEVDVEQMGSTSRSTMDTDMDSRFRADYDSNYANSGYTYEQYTPAYRYGSQFANDSTYRDRDWTDVENDVRTRWEERNPGTWEQFKDAVRYAWDAVRGRN